MAFLVTIEDNYRKPLANCMNGLNMVEHDQVQCAYGIFTLT